MFKKRKELHKINGYYHDVFDTPTGEEVLKHLVSVSGLLKPTPIGDPYMTAHAEGMKYLMLSILNFLKRTPAQILKLMEEREDGI